MLDRKRKEDRIPWTSAIFFSGMASSPNEGFGNYWAAAVNISPSGICLFTNMAVKPGHYYGLMRKSRLSPLRQARAVWCSEVAGGLYRAGFSFTHIFH